MINKKSSKRKFVLLALSIIAFFNVLDRAIFSILAVSIKKDLMLSDTEVGLLGGLAFALFYAVLGIPLARYADRSNRVRLLSICLTVWSIATAACGAAIGFISLLFARTGVGAGEAGCFPSSYSILSDYFPPHKRAFAIGLFHAGGNVGFLVGLMAAGILAELVGWRMTFVLMGIPGVLFALFFVLTVKEPIRGAQELSPEATITGNEGFGKTIHDLLSKSAMLHLIIGYTLSIFGFYGALQWLPHFFVRSHSMTSSQIGFWYGLAFGGGMIIGVVIGALLSAMLIPRDRRWEMWLPGFGTLAALPCFMSIYIVEQLDIAIGLTFLACLVISSGLGPGFSAIQSLAKPNMRATAASIVLLVSAIIGQGLGPTMIGVMSDYLTISSGENSLRIALMISCVAFGWSAFHYIWGARKFRQQLS